MSPASPINCIAAMTCMETPVAPIGCPLDFRPPEGLTGSLKSKGQPIGATGVSMHVMAAMQLMGEAGDMQIGQPSLGGVFNMGGAAVANYVSILERVR